MSILARPTVFIGSSKEGLGYAEAIQTALEATAESTLWDQDVFQPTQGTLEALERMCHKFDFAIFLMSPDDLRESRGQGATVPRDNVVFELGLFIGAIGRERVFFLKPQAGVAMPTDFLGITALRYDSERRDGNSLAAVRSACNQIRSQMEKVGSQEPSNAVRDSVAFWHTLSDRRADGCDMPALLRKVERRAFLSSVEMRFLVEHSVIELRSALQRGVRVEVAIADSIESYFPIYERRESRIDHAERFKENLDLFERFIARISDQERQYFGVYGTSFPITHSIGIYDNDIYIREISPHFKSSRSPSYRIIPPCLSHDLFIEEALDILMDSTPLFGSSEPTLSK